MHIAPIETFDALAAEIHADNVNAGWWTDLHTGQSILETRNMGELLMLCVSEVSEAWEGFAGDLHDDKLATRLMFEVELADTAIRLFDIAGARKVPLYATATVLLDDRERISEVGRSASFELLQIVNALSSAMEGDRKSDRERFMKGVTAALLRVYEVAHDRDFDVVTAISQKRAFNRSRADHQIQNRLAAGGKRY